MGDERWDEAIAAFMHLQMTNEPRDRQMAYRNLGACYLALERYDDALSALDEAERLVSGDSDVLRSRGVVLACAGRILEAIATFEGFARRWPEAASRYKTHETIDQLRRIQRGEIPAGTYLAEHLQERISHNINMGDWQLVEHKSKRLIAAAPDRPEGHFDLGIACLQQGRYAEALDAFLAAHVRDPAHASTLFYIGYVHLQLGQAAQAIPWLGRALDQDPQSLATMYQMGVASELLGRREEAVTWWRRVLHAEPDHYPTQERLHELGLGPEPQEPPPSPKRQQMLEMAPIVKARMRHPHVHHVGGLTLTWDGKVGFVLEDADNSHNYTIHAGGPFQAARLPDEDVLDLMGVIKQLLRMIDADNTRDIAVLVYYDKQTTFVYQARFERGEQVEFDADGQFIVTRVPRFFKVRIDSDFSTPYGDPMQGTLIYLNRRPGPGFMVSTLGLQAK